MDLKNFDVFIEIPQGTKNNKFERDTKSGKLVLDFVFENLVWPFNYGEIVGTKGGDGDSLDAIVFSTSPLQQGAVVRCVPFGVLLTVDRGEVDDKVLLVPAYDALTNLYRDIQDFSEQERKIITDLYQEIARQKKKTIEIKGFKNKQTALQEIKKSLI